MMAGPSSDFYALSQANRMRMQETAARFDELQQLLEATKPTVPPISTGHGLLPKDLLTDLEQASDIPARIARHVEALIVRANTPAVPQQQFWPQRLGGMQWASTTAMMNFNPFLRRI